jgi:hypothetical protein
MDIDDFEAGLASLMMDPPGGENHGYVVNGGGARYKLGTRAAAALEMTGILDGNQRGGVLSTRAGKAGLTSHRGALHPDEWKWLDCAEVVRQAEQRLGCTFGEAREVYGRTGGGPLPRRLLPLRDRLDVVMGGIAHRGGNLAELARGLGVPERNLQRAAERGSGAAPRRPR